MLSDGRFPYWARRIATAGYLAVLTATSPRRLPPPSGGPPLTGTNPLAIAIPSSDGEPLVADVSMGAVTHGDVIAGRARAEELVPFGGELAHKAFALAVGLELFVSALAGPEHSAVLLVARPEHDVVPGFRTLAERSAAAGRRVEGAASGGGKRPSPRIASRSPSVRASSANRGTSSTARVRWSIAAPSRPERHSAQARL